MPVEFDRILFEQLIDQRRFVEARDELDKLEPGHARRQLGDMLFRLWSYTDRVGITTMREAR